MKCLLRIPVVVILVLAQVQLCATIFTIGPDQDYKTPNELYQANQADNLIQDHDTIQVKAGIYLGQEALAVWNNNNLLIKGIDGMAELYAEGQYIIGKGIFVSEGNNNTFENIAFHNAAVPDLNGAGIRLDGSGLTVRNCLFSNNENGILANNSENGEVLIEHSEFIQGGAGDGFSHNIYINHCAKLTIQFCYFHSAVIGHQIKSRATNNLIRYNRIADNEGNSSRLIDLPNGGKSVILGNEMIQGANAENNNLIGYGLEGLNNATPHELFVVNNTILNYRQASCVFFDVVEEAEKFEVINNILGGQCNMYSKKEALADNNLVNADITIFMLNNEASGNYLLESTSPCIDAGTAIMNDTLLDAVHEYEFPLGKIERIKDEAIDVGAHEFLSISNSVNPTKTKDLSLFPNPFEDEIFFTKDLSNCRYRIFDTFGKEIAEGIMLSQIMRLKTIDAGIYFLVIKDKQQSHSFKIVKI